MNKLYLMLISTMLLCMSHIDTAYAMPTPQSDNKDNEEVIFIVVEQMPEFPGGQEALFHFLSDNVKYPIEAYKNGIMGRVICQFIVDTDGNIVNVEVIRSVDPLLDAEAVRVIQSMPKWKPGKNKGKPVRVKYTIPVNFSIQ